MGTLTEYMKRVVAQHKLGYVATVSEDGTPNLSPKATFVVVDDDHLAFGEIRSPNTVRNIAERPAMEVNFIDPFARKGFRAKGQAVFLARDTHEFDELIPRFSEWGELCENMRGIVRLQVECAVPVTSPAYDRGAEESALREHWLKYFNELQSR